MLGNPHRWRMLQILADGRPRTATEVAHLLHRDFDGVSKHLRLMCQVGVLDWRVGDDRRLTYFSLPAAFRQTPGLLDFGVCTARLP